MSFINVTMLFALSALAIPVVIHLLHRRRFDVVEWGAMQFLQSGQTTRRRLALEEILLLALRMTLVGLLVLALAGPKGSGALFSLLGTRPARSFALIVDGSYSMGFDNGRSKTPHQTAKEWVLEFLETLAPGDSVALFRAQEQVISIVPRPTQDLGLVKEKIAKLPQPHGGSDLPRAVAEAIRNFPAGDMTEIILLSDGRQHGLTDSNTLLMWEKLATGWQLRPDRHSKIRLIDFFPEVSEYSNYFLAPLKPGRALAWTGQEVIFKTALGMDGFSVFQPPHRIRLEIDGQMVKDLPPPKTGLVKGQIPFAFSHRFTKAGSHLVSVILEADIPKENRPTTYRLRDCLAGDNRQDYSLEVVDSIPVLLVDGDARLSPESSSYFLNKAMTQSPNPKRSPVINAQVVTGQDFVPPMLTGDGKKPRVLILADVPNLTLNQEQSIARFLAEGGGVFVVLGPRAANGMAYYNEQLYREGKGWLPAKLENVFGDLGKLEEAATPDARSFQHPTLELFRAATASPFMQARFPRWWKVTPEKGVSTNVALLSNTDPFLVEKETGRGRVLLCAVPLDRSWGANLPTLWEYPVLIHELVAYLAAAKTVEFNVQAGQPIYFHRRRQDENSELILFPPEGEANPLKTEGLHWFFETKEAGVYRLEAKHQTTAYYVANYDQTESDLTPATKEERQKLTDLLGMEFLAKDVFPSWEQDGSTQELWWLFLLAVILLLCSEVWLTRRMARG